MPCQILERTPFEGLGARSTTSLRGRDYLPYRIDLAGGWLDQPFVSQHYPGAVVTISLEPTLEFNERSGMASSTRRHARELWGVKVPPGNYEKLAKMLFCWDNPPEPRSSPARRIRLGWFSRGWRMRTTKAAAGPCASNTAWMSHCCVLWKMRCISCRSARAMQITMCWQIRS